MGRKLSYQRAALKELARLLLDGKAVPNGRRDIALGIKPPPPYPSAPPNDAERRANETVDILRKRAHATDYERAKFRPLPNTPSRRAVRTRALALLDGINEGDWREWL